MNWRPSSRRTLSSAFSSVCAAGRVVACALLIVFTGCNYSFRAGSGLPEYVRTVAVLPFENDTNRFELTEEIRQSLERDLPRALGVRSGGEELADAVVSGTIRSYNVNAPLYRPSAGGDRAQVIQREVAISVYVQIVDRVANQVLWEDQALNVRGQYLEDSETEEIGRAEAIELLIQRIIDGAQSNW